MALTLGNPSLSQTQANAWAADLAADLSAGASESTIEYHENPGIGLVVTFELTDASPEFTVSANVVSLDVSTPVSAEATAGSNTTPNEYRVIDGDGNERLRGPITGTGAINTSDTVNLGSLTFTVPTNGL